MGTSSDFTGGRGGAWTGYKRAASQFAKKGGRPGAQRVLARHVGTLGGAGAAVGSAATGRHGAQRLGGFLAGVAERGLESALRDAGLDELIGRPRYDVLAGLVDDIAGAGDDLEAVAARSAALDVLDDLLPDGDGYDDIADVQLDGDGVRSLLAAFLAAYVYNRAAAIVEERLNRLNDPVAAQARDREIREVVRSIVDLRLARLDTLSVDWAGPAGRAEVDSLLADVYEIIEAYE